MAYPDSSDKIEDQLSSVGIAAIVSGGVAFLSMLFLFGGLYFLLRDDPMGNNIPPFLNRLLEGIWQFAGFCICFPSLTGTIFGTIGLFQKNISKRNAKVGLSLGLITAIVFCSVLIWVVTMGIAGV